jgi:hypothetical protein
MEPPEKGLERLGAATKRCDRDMIGHDNLLDLAGVGQETLVNCGLMARAF